MPKIVGKSTRVVEVGGFAIDELAGNVASHDDTISIARVVVSEVSSEPWLTLDYDEWICVLKGRIEMHFVENGQDKVLPVNAGETCFVAKGERFRPFFPEGNTEYIPVCLPAFKPERCLREEEGVSDVSAKLQQLHSNGTAAGSCSAADASTDEIEKLYHMCQKSLWEAAVVSKSAYFPPTFDVDGYFTHATAVPARLLDTANHFYTSTQGDWICLELSNSALKTVGVVTRFEEPKPVGETSVDQEWNEWRCPHIFGGIPCQVPGVVTGTFVMKRDADGKFLSIDGLTN
jgi:uncharacterized protein (DUF952 family)/mannose-6-phosphate isomerase-like protein (cupin superfamily)